jgi:transposase-like protein
MRQSYRADFRAEGALEAVKVEWSRSELASRYEGYPHQIGPWRKTLLVGVTEVAPTNGAGWRGGMRRWSAQGAARLAE